jgi:hypothetical protein
MDGSHGCPLFVDLIKSFRMTPLLVKSRIIVWATASGAKHVSNEISPQIGPSAALHLVRGSATIAGSNPCCHAVRTARQASKQITLAARGHTRRYPGRPASIVGTDSLRYFAFR